MAEAIAEAREHGLTLNGLSMDSSDANSIQRTIDRVYAIGAYGGFFIPKSFGTSIDLTGTPHAALWCFVVFYFSCVVVTWFWYARRNAPMPC